MDYVNRLPAFEETEAYRNLCADRGITPIERPADGLAYVLPDLADDPALPPLSDPDGEARKLEALRKNI